MVISFKDNLIFFYFNVVYKLYFKKVCCWIVVYVESYDDVVFWCILFEEFEDEEYYF